MRKDVKAAELGRLEWGEGDPTLESLRAIHGYVDSHLKSTADWYIQAKKAKRLGARVLRIGVILLSSLTVIMPVLIGMDLGDVPFLRKPPIASVSILAAVAATFLLLDSFIGCSTGWIRYVRTHFEVMQIHQRFLIDWAELMSRLDEKARNSAGARPFFVLARQAIVEVNQVIQNESDEWAAEFSNALKQIEAASERAAVRADSEVRRSSQVGSLALQVANGDQCVGGWRVAVNDGAPQAREGKDIVFNRLPIGPCKVAVVGVIGTSKKRVETLAMIESDKITRLELTLA